MKLVFLIISFLCCYHIQAQNLVIKNVNVVDVENGKILSGKDVTIADGMIQSIEKSKRKITADHIDGTNKYLIPGLIDAHMHLFQSGGLYTRPDAINLQHIVPYNTERQWLYEKTEDILRRYLSQGITSVIDIGGPMYNLAYKDSINQMSNTAHTYLTGPLVSTYLPKELDVEYPPIVKATDAAMAKEFVINQMEFNPDFIKIWFVILKQQDALDYRPMIKAAIEEAKRHHKPVAVHAKELITAKIALELGADYLVHSVSDVEIDEEFIELLKSSNAVYCPTMQVSSNTDKVFYGDYDATSLDYKIALPKALGSLMDIRHINDSRDLEYYQANKTDILSRQKKSDTIAKINLKRINDSGIPIALGTDAGNIGTMHASSYFREIELMKSAGMSDVDILKSATINAAKAIRKQLEIGSVDTQKKADLLILNHNPLIDIGHLKDIDLIIKDGILIDQSSLIIPTSEDIVQRQLNAYNGHDLDAFMELYAEDVKIYNFPNELVLEGKDMMRQSYKFLEDTPAMHCELLNRTVLGQTVIDHERVTFDIDKPPSDVIAIFKIKEDKISTVHFIR